MTTENVNRAWCLGNKQSRKEVEMKKTTMTIGALMMGACITHICYAYDDPMRGVLNNIVMGPQTSRPVQEDRTMSYDVGNSSGSRIKALYFKGAGTSSWSGNCVADSSALDWLNTHVLYLQRSGRQYGSPSAYMRPGERERDLNGNYWMSAGQMVVDVPLGGYDGYAYRMKVCWEDGTVREFHLPYPWGSVTIYKNQVKVYLGVSGRGLFYNNWIDAL